MPASAPKHRNDVRLAWICVGLLPVAAVLASVALPLVLHLLGVDRYADATMSQALGAGISAFLVLTLPGVGAFWFGTSAIGEGNERGRLPGAIGAIWVLVAVLAGIALLILTQLKP
jgi:hypothetical protein